MIEVNDEKLGNIKLLNVTEARSQFASVLSDETCCYVITKNNKPKRVVINYEEFLLLRGMTDVSASDEVITKSILQNEEPKKPKSRVRGLLEESMAFVQTPGETSKKNLPLPVAPLKKAVGENEIRFDLTPTSLPVEKMPKPENADYYQKYKKLYEGEAGLTPPVANTLDLTETSDPSFDLNKHQIDTPPLEPLNLDDSLPSLKDLLKDLENERLSGEEELEQISDEAIDDIIKRITTNDN